MIHIRGIAVPDQLVRQLVAGVEILRQAAPVHGDHRANPDALDVQAVAGDGDAVADLLGCGLIRTHPSPGEPASPGSFYHRRDSL